MIKKKRKRPKHLLRVKIIRNIYMYIFQRQHQAFEEKAPPPHTWGMVASTRDKSPQRAT